MKYRIQMSAVFNNTDSNAILNQIESIKSNVYKAEYFTPIFIERKTTKSEITELNNEAVVYDFIDFDDEVINHVNTPEGVTNFNITIDISFSTQQHMFDFLNYVESIKAKSLENELRYCRYFSCRHEELTTPLLKDGEYFYIDFDGEIIVHE